MAHVSSEVTVWMNSTISNCMVRGAGRSTQRVTRLIILPDVNSHNALEFADRHLPVVGQLQLKAGVSALRAESWHTSDTELASLH